MKNIELYYDSLADIYDIATDSKWFVNMELSKLLKDYNLLQKGLTILDLGIGTGQSIEELVNKNNIIYGIDISSKMLDVVQRKYPTVKKIKYDITKGLDGLKFKNKYFDMVISIGILEFIEDIEIIIKDSFKLTKQGGHLVFTYEVLMPENKWQKLKMQRNSDGYIENPPKNMNFNLYRRSKEEIEEMIMQSGFKTLRHYRHKVYLKGPNKIPVYYGIVLAVK